MAEGKCIVFGERKRNSHQLYETTHYRPYRFYQCKWGTT